MPAEIGSALWPRMARWDAMYLDQVLAGLKAPLLAIQSTYLNAERKRLPLEKGQSSPWLDLLKAQKKGFKIEVVPGVGHFTQLEAARTGEPADQRLCSSRSMKR